LWSFRLQLILTYLLTPCSRVLLEKLTGSWSRNSPHFMKSKGSLLCLQVPDTCPYPEPEQSSPCPPSHFLKIHLNIILLSMPGSFEWSLFLKFPHHQPVCTSPPPIHATYPVHLILLVLNTQIISDEEYGSLSSSLCSSFHSPCYLIPLRPKYYPQHPILKHPQSTFPSQCQHPTFTPIYNKGKIIVLCILHLHILE